MPLPRSRERAPVIDNLALGISHALLLLAAVMLLRRPDLDREPPPESTPDA